MDSLTNGWNELVRNVVTWLPKLAAFLLILAIGFIVAKVLAKAVDALLERVGFDRVIERGGIGRMLASSEYDASDIMAKLVYWAIALVTLNMAFGVFGPNPVSDVLTSVVAFIPKLIVGIVIFIIVAAIANAVRDIVTGTLGGISYGKTLGTIAYVSILFLGGVAALNQIGIAVTVTTSVLTAVLAALTGIAIVGIGGGLIKPMQSRWEGWLNTIEAETPKLKAKVAQASEERQARLAREERVSARVEQPAAVAPEVAYSSQTPSFSTPQVQAPEVQTPQFNAPQAHVPTPGAIAGGAVAGAGVAAAGRGVDFDAIPEPSVPEVSIPQAEVPTSTFPAAAEPTIALPDAPVAPDSVVEVSGGAVQTSYDDAVAASFGPAGAGIDWREQASGAPAAGPTADGESFSATWLRTHGYGTPGGDAPAAGAWGAGDNVTTGPAASDAAATEFIEGEGEERR